MPPAQSDTNGRITMAIIGEKLEMLIAESKDIKHEVKQYNVEAQRRETRITVLEKQMVDACTDVNKLDASIDNIWRNSKIYDGIISFATMCFSALLSVFNRN